MARESTGSFVQFLRVSQGSLKELETHLMLAQTSLGCGNLEAVEPILARCESLGRMLRAFDSLHCRKIRRSR